MTKNRDISQILDQNTLFTAAVNATAFTTTGFRANATHVVSTSNSSGQTFGNTISRWVITANSVTTSGGVSPDSNTLGTALGSTTQRWNLTGNSVTLTGQLANSLGLYPTSNTVGQLLGNTISRWDITYIGGSANSTGLYPISNTAGQAFGNTVSRWAITANSLTISGAISANGTVGSGGQALLSDGTISYWGSASAAAAIGTPINLGLAASAAGSALTITLTDASGSTPSSGSPVSIAFRNVTEATGTPSVLSITASTTLVISSGSTLGVTTSNAFRLWVVGFNDGGTFRLGVKNCSTAGQIFPLSDYGVDSSTAEGGAGAADSAGVFYTGTAVTSKSYRILGFVEWSATGLTAGTWTTTNLNRIQLYGPGVKLPGDIVQSVYTNVSTSPLTGTATIPFDNTIPQITEGDQYVISPSVALTSAVNHVKVLATSCAAPSIDVTPSYWLFRSGQNNALIGNLFSGSARTSPIVVYFQGRINTTSGNTYELRMSAAGSTLYVNTYSGGPAMFGGAQGTQITVTELMA